MPQGDKSKYTDKQKRQAEHIEKGYEKKGLSEAAAAARAWATVNKRDKGGKKNGSGRDKKKDTSSSVKDDKKGGSSQSYATRVRAGKKAARTRKRNSS